MVHSSVFAVTSLCLYACTQPCLLLANGFVHDALRTTVPKVSMLQLVSVAFAFQFFCVIIIIIIISKFIKRHVCLQKAAELSAENVR